MQTHVEPSILPNLLFLFTLLFVSSLIAFAGDWVGRRVGKKRLSLFSLRPRDTGVLVTVLTGMLIAGFTVLVLALVSENVRDALLRVDEIKQERALLEQENTDLRYQQGRLDRQLDQVQQALGQSEITLASQEQRLQNSQERLKAAQERQRQARARMGELQGRLSAMRSRLDTTQAEYNTVKGELATIQGQLAGTEEDLASAQQELTDAQDELANARQELTNATDAAFAEFRKTQELTRQRQQLEQEVARLREEQKALVGALQQASELLASLQTGILVADAGEEFARGSMDPTWPGTRLRQRLDDLLADAGRRAAKRGASPGPNERAVRAYGLRRSPGGQMALLPEEAFLEQLLREIQAQGRPVIARLIALRRFVKGEQILLGFDIRPERIIFPQGELLVATEIRADADESEIFAALLQLLRQVHDKARSAGLLPNPEGQFGVLPYAELFARLREIQRLGGQVSVQAFTAHSIWTGDPLNLRLVVVPAGQQAPAGPPGEDHAS